MTLHQHTKIFHDVLKATAQHLSMKLEFVEKDYWISLLLFRLSKSSYSDKIVFKGGTSLSKGFNLIERFSEDVDIAVIDKAIETGNQLKKVIRSVEKEITAGLIEKQIDGVTSKGSRFRKSIFEYPSIKEGVNNRIIVEINSFANPFPYKQRTIRPFIYDFLNQTDDKYLMKYGITPFKLNVLNKEQTLMEKLVSLIRVSFTENKIEGIAQKIRHFYDLYYLMQDNECKKFLNSKAFKDKFQTLLNHDKKIFDKPKDWAKHTLEESVLFRDFPQIWKQLKQQYKSELSALSYRAIPDEKEVEREFKRLIEYIL